MDIAIISAGADQEQHEVESLRFNNALVTMFLTIIFADLRLVEVEFLKSASDFILISK